MIKYLSRKAKAKCCVCNKHAQIELPIDEQIDYAYYHGYCDKCKDITEFEVRAWHNLL